MGSPIIGRTDCPECKFGSAHVKKSEKCTYRFCPECGATYHAKTARQVADLMAKTRLEKGAEPAPIESASPAPAAAPVAAPAPTPAPTKAKPAKAPQKPEPKTEPEPKKRALFDI